MSSRFKFEFIAGGPALNFVDTFGNRGGEGRERLVSVAAFGEWLARAGLSDGTPRMPADTHLDDARSLREAIFRCCLCVIEDRPMGQGDIGQLNHAAAKMPLRPQLQDGGLFLVGANPVEAALSVLAEDAIDLIASPRRARIRQCPGCAMVFEDTSRPGKRQWCSSASGCGNRAKVRALRARRVLGQKDV
ncbi:ABATE domain-containing protein (plasmid) [Ensifer adhaerens]|uniref:CGNR zinc finger domain-containing protein n=1 Tax=Ensifer adhaerens TaxID=106592 RepID=UPI001CC146FC|nr:CGNR zinc finger domain-containing protein [Ensifer adhaerens]MBZ7927358.1 ABATE domain-containing protein [Ensifer adhaerens]UAX98365.1 ABATE domain-containing protein [Ensifer adhaerens]UAY05748.1 ABATE domain-containing protein [Ensifer adhaerens]UAY13126.1 ABATE domain-containing protein [Ensifer adhaerens]